MRFACSYECYVSCLHDQNYFIQVSLRDPLRYGADDNELKEIIGAAVGSFNYLDNIVAQSHPHCGKAKQNGTRPTRTSWVDYFVEWVMKGYLASM